MQIVYKACDIAEAHIVAGLLHTHDINNHVSGFYLQGAIGDLGASDFANVQVDDADFDQARKVVAEYERGRYEGGVAEEELLLQVAPEDASGQNEKNSLTSVAASGIRIALLVCGCLILLLYLVLN